MSFLQFLFIVILIGLLSYVVICLIKNKCINPFNSLFNQESNHNQTTTTPYQGYPTEITKCFTIPIPPPQCPPCPRPTRCPPCECPKKPPVCCPSCPVHNSK